MGICTILKDEVGDIIQGLHMANLDRLPEYHLALAAVATSLGQSEVVAQITQYLRKKDMIDGPRSLVP